MHIGTHSGQVAPTGQQYYPFHPLRRNGGNGDRGPSDPPENGGHYPHRSNGGYGDLHSVSGGSGDGPLNDSNRACSDTPPLQNLEDAVDTMYSTT